jgi:hypothetical protein
LGREPYPSLSRGRGRLWYLDHAAGLHVRACGRLKADLGRGSGSGTLATLGRRDLGDVAS